MKRRSAPRRLLLIAIATLTATLSTGCYTHNSLIERVRSRAIRLRIEEVEIGEFRVTLPRNDRTSELTEVDLRIFGLSPRYKINEIERELEEREYAIRDNTLKVLRNLTHDDLVDPDLDTIRDQLLVLYNQLLDEEPLEGLGFYNVRFTRH